MLELLPVAVVLAMLFAARWGHVRERRRQAEYDAYMARQPKIAGGAYRTLAPPGPAPMAARVWLNTELRISQLRRRRLALGELLFEVDRELAELDACASLRASTNSTGP